MPTLATLMSLSAAGFAVVEGEPIPTIECVFARGDFYSAPDWDSLEFYANNYRLCDCGNFYHVLPSLTKGWH